MPSAPFNWRAYDAYLFDIDGTLLNTNDGVHYNSFHTALREVYGCEGRIDHVPVHGNTDIGILRAALKHHGLLRDDEFESKLPRALEMMCAEVERNADRIRPELCPSIAELLASLHSDGKLLGVVTGNLERIGWRKLQAAGIRKYFAFGSFSDTPRETRRHLPSRRRTRTRATRTADDCLFRRRHPGRHSRRRRYRAAGNRRGHWNLFSRSARRALAAVVRGNGGRAVVEIRSPGAPNLRVFEWLGH